MSLIVSLQYLNAVVNVCWRRRELLWSTICTLWGLLLFLFLWFYVTGDCKILYAFDGVLDSFSHGLFEYVSSWKPLACNIYLFLSQCRAKASESKHCMSPICVPRTRTT